VSSNIHNLAIATVLFPLAGAIIAGLFGKEVGRAGAHRVTILGVGVACFFSLGIFVRLFYNGEATHEATLYTWGNIGGLELQVGFLIDKLTAVMMVVVTSVSLMVHIYTIGYMKEDPGYQRFFSYISLFTFSMLVLVMSNNFLQLFFGWEAVGVVSYLLIGFWYTRDTAIYANLKAFLVNRVGDFGFLLGIAAILMYFGALDYKTVFAAAPNLVSTEVHLFSDSAWGLVNKMDVVCILLFIGAMGKSAQVPLHVWLPDSMEGPTPISALIHAATMVTAGIFMVARMSPLFELSEAALSFILIIGATTAFFMGLLGLVQNDIKRVVAYSTLSQLGYMTVALGASAYSAAIFHLGTHAFFKALLFLAAGSVIIAMHHKQDMREMGGLWKIMPITWITSLIGTLALIGFPGFAGFYSKDAIIVAVGDSQLAGASYAYACVVAGVFITSLYSFRLYFMVFHGKPRMDDHTREHLHETSAVVWMPLVLLAIPSVIIGGLYAGPMLVDGMLGDAIHVDKAHETLDAFASHWHGAWEFALHGFTQLPFFLGAAGFAVAWYLYIVSPQTPAKISAALRPVVMVLEAKYGFDRFNEVVFAGGARRLGGQLWRKADAGFIDGVLVNGTAKLVGQISSVVRHLQTGFLYHYAFAMILGLLAFLAWIVHGG
jgi:NADH-quinone oxidoreductase subunit L